MVRRSVSLLLLVFACGVVFAQTKLRVELAPGSSVPSTIALGSQFSVNLTIYNDDTATFNGNLALSYAINGDSIGAVSDSVSGLQYNLLVSVNVSSGDSIVMQNVKVNVSGPKFSVGPSVVVIWPVANGVLQQYDSLVMVFDVDQINDSRLKVGYEYGELWIHNPDHFPLYKVRIFDLMGRVVHDLPFTSNRIPIRNTASGLYIVEIIHTNGKRKTLRFILQ